MKQLNTHEAPVASHSGIPKPVSMSSFHTKAQTRRFMCKSAVTGFRQAPNRSLDQQSCDTMN